MSDMTPEEIKAEIAEARRMVREDKILAGQKAIHEKLSKHFPDEPTSPEPPEGTPPAPPAGDPPTDPPKKKGVWWGDAIDN
jgi:hypothetical protein